MMRKKGMLYTLGLSLFIFVVLLLAVLFFRHAGSVESRNIELSFFQKNYDLDNSIQNVFTWAFVSKSGIVFSSDYSSLTIEENLPDDFTELDNLISELESKVENDFSAVNISLETFLDGHGLVLMPLNITYKHTSSGIFIESNPNITGYNVTLIFTENITSCTPDIEGGGTVEIDFLGQSLGDDCVVSQDNVEEGEIDLIVGGEEVTIELGEDGEFTIESNASVSSMMTISFNELDQRTYFQLPIILELTDPVFSFYKRSEVKFPLSVD